MAVSLFWSQFSGAVLAVQKLFTALARTVRQ
jgi:hypothetical protein